MAVAPSHHSPQVHKLPQYTYIDALRWMPHISTISRHILFATYDSDSSTPSLQTLTFSPSRTAPSLILQASVSAPSRITALKVSPSSFSSTKPIAAAATFSGSVLFYSAADLINGTLNLEFSVPENGFHMGPVSGIDLSDSGSECVSIGEDGRVNLINLATKDFRRVFESNGLVSYSSVRWASPVEFVTGSFGFGLHWWDQRKAGGPVALFKGNWTGGATSGIIHSIDIHPSRKHTSLAGGSSGALFAWDIRSPKESVVLSGAGFHGAPANSLVESDIWEVRYDNYTHTSKIRSSSSSSSRILPAMICSEDGILGVVEQGDEQVELLAEPCAINSFDIDKQNPSDVICSLEWESIAMLTRPGSKLLA